jgi:prepilin-type N-terminal cleavage/methylation domain-containing protein
MNRGATVEKNGKFDGRFSTISSGLAIWKLLRPGRARSGGAHRDAATTAIAFTLIELLVVISIMGIIAALTVPALKNLGKSNVQASAARQLRDDIGHARQMAISQHTTVYMVFVATNFWLPPWTPSVTWTNTLNVSDLGIVANLADKQLMGYNFISLGRVGDQPGQHAWHYLSTWQSLPEGNFIAAQKFALPTGQTPMQIPLWQSDYAGQIDNWQNALLQVYGFTNSSFPFPTDTSSNWVLLPYIAFDDTGRLISETPNGSVFHHAYIPLAQGSVGYGRDVNKQPALTPVQPGDVTENLPGNSTGISYNVIDVDPLSGRATLMYHHLP